jgi:four helix bundle protein
MKRGYQQLLVWRQAMDLARDCYFLTKNFPKEELYGLTSQIRRASISIAANIAEGNRRGTRKDYVSFLRIAQGSVRELETYLILITEIHWAQKEVITPLLAQVGSVARLLNRLIQSLQPKPITP